MQDEAWDFHAFAEAWVKGRVCLHPTDTLLGLSFNPHSLIGAQNFASIKSRAPDKSPISLIANWDLAVRTWKPLPGPWSQVLQDLWPASLSVIWEASDLCPKAIIGANGTCGLRLPNWSPDKQWMHELLTKLEAPFPSSSVNLSGQAAIGDWATAVQFLKAEGKDDMVFIPDLGENQIRVLGEGARLPLPSTLIRIEAGGGWTMLREGALNRASIQSTWEDYAKRS